MNQASRVRSLGFLAVFVLLGVAACARLPVSPAASDAALSAEQHLMGDGVMIAGTLHDDAFRHLVPGARVIDLRTEREGTAAAAARAQALGIDYHNVPIAGEAVDPDAVNTVAALIAAAQGGPVLLHCASGNRAGMIWGAVQVRAGRSLDEVQERLAAVPMRSGAQDALAQYARER